MLKGLYFPGLRPEQSWVEALLPLVERLVVYGMVESESLPGAVSMPWELKVVAPLGDDRGRFQALLREMTGRDAAVIRGQLLALASRPGRDRDEANAWRLSSALHRMEGGGAGADLASARVERLWQARLFLQLAETVTAAEAEINMGLAQMAAKQAEMLQALQGEDDGEDADEAIPLAPVLRPPPVRPFRLREQLAAWAVFYLLDPGPEALLLTDEPEAAALLVDAVEERAPGQAVALPELGLDLAEGDLSAVVGFLHDIFAGRVEDGRNGLRTLVESRRQLQVAGGPASNRLSLQALPGAVFRQVMAELSGFPGEDGATASASPFVLVGAITPGEAY